MARAQTRAMRARRTPVERDRYRATARKAGVKPRLRRAPRALDAVVLGGAAAFVLLAGPFIGSAFDQGIRQLGESFGDVFPTTEGKRIDLPTTGVVFGAEPVVSGLPDFTREPQLQIGGRVPSFAVGTGRMIEVVVNGAVIGTVKLDTSGTFAATATLKDGPNAIGVTLLSGTDVVARSSYTVVLDRQPPSLSITRPREGETITGSNVIVEGRTETGATVSVNAQTVVPGPDGAFSATLPSSPGPLAITIIARDRAGNESTVKGTVNVVAETTVAPTTVTVALDRSKVRPGEAVLAEIRVAENGRPKANVTVTLSVGVITIGTAVTDSGGIAHIGFAAPPNEGDAAVVVLAAGAAGRAPLTVAR